ncbi:MAG: MoxR family ATPase [Clostridia bacterium]|nr:MoxR family ATPase [Clostridia bacterium]
MGISMGFVEESRLQPKIKDIRDNVNRVIVGKEEVIDLLLTALLSDGHVLLEDVPGTGKTIMAKTLAKSIDAEFSRIQFTPDLVPSDVTGIHYYNQKSGEFVLRKGPVFANIILADEINRATPRTQSSLLECMEERQVTIDGETMELEKPFVVIATQNPVETAGTYMLPEAQLDRFLMKISVGYPTKQEELAMMNRFLIDNPIETIQPVCSREDVAAMQKEAQKVYVHPCLMEYIADIAEATRNLPNVSIGVSPRGTLTMLRAVRAYAYLNKRSYVVPEDIKTLSVPVLAHRLVLKLGMIQQDNRAALIRGVMERCPLPTEDWSK